MNLLHNNTSPKHLCIRFLNKQIWRLLLANKANRVMLQSIGASCRTGHIIKSAPTFKNNTGAPCGVCPVIRLIATIKTYIYV